MSYVRLRKNETLEGALKRFKKAVDRDGIIKECRNRQYYVKPSTQKHQAKVDLEHKLKRKKKSKKQY